MIATILSTIPLEHINCEFPATKLEENFNSLINKASSKCCKNLTFHLISQSRQIIANARNPLFWSADSFTAWLVVFSK